jgi:hypothetical protein
VLKGLISIKVFEEYEFDYIILENLFNSHILRSRGVLLVRIIFSFNYSDK